MKIVNFIFIKNRSFIQMGRKNIFEILAEKEDIAYQLDRIETLLSERSIDGWTLEEFVDEYCIRDWKYRGRCTSCREIRERLCVTFGEVKKNIEDINVVLNYLEYISNLIWLCNEEYIDNIGEFYDAEYQYLQENVIGLVEDLGYEIKVLDEEQRVLIVEKNPAVTAVSEIVPIKLSNKVIEYNHFHLKGELEEKRKILLSLADKFEPLRKQLKNVNPNLESNTGFLLNKMNIRHNNKEGKNASEYVANLADEELEKWYDETYQMLLLAMLEVDNIERNRMVNELKKIIEG